jgi:hypothetical protein
MQKLTVFLAFSITVLVGCSSTHNVQKDAAAEWTPEASERLTGSSVTVTDRTLREYEGEVVTLDDRQIRLSGHTAGTSVFLPLDSVMSISSGSNAWSIVLGTLVGIVTGGLLGALIGDIAAGDPRSSLGLPRGGGTFQAAVGMFIGAPVGGILGGVIVGVATQTHDYVIVESAETPQRVTTVP